MRKIWLLALAGLFATPALADFTGKNGSAATITFKSSGDCTSVVCIVPHYLVDSTGAAVGVVGSPLYMGFGTGVTLPAYASTPTFNLGTLNGAATAAKQPALGTAGTASADVLSVQGVVSMTPLKTDGSAVTQPVSAASLPLPAGAATSAAQGTMTSALGSPFQAGGSIGNTAFGISGTLPAFAATPTFNCGTGCSSTGGTFNNNADAVANSSTNGQSASWGYFYNGTTWDRSRGDTTNGQWVNVKASAPIGTTTDVPCTLPASATACTQIAVQKALANAANSGTATPGSAAPSSAIYVGGLGKTADPTAVTDGQLVAMLMDKLGRIVTSPYAIPENALNGQITSAMTGTTSTAVTGMGAQGAGVRVYVTACIIGNSHATAGTMVNLQDGSGGSVLAQIPAAPAYGGGVVPFPTPIKTTANTGLFAVNATTGSSTFVSCTGYKGA